MPFSSSEIRDVVHVVEQDIVQGFGDRLQAQSPGPAFEVVLLDTGLPEDQIVTVSDQVVSVPWVFHAKHEGTKSFLGVPPTHLKIDLAGTTFVTVPDPKDESTWTFTRYIDFLGALNQMGVSVMTRPALTPDQFKQYQSES